VCDDYPGSRRGPQRCFASEIESAPRMSPSLRAPPTKLPAPRCGVELSAPPARPAGWSCRASAVALDPMRTAASSSTSAHERAVGDRRARLREVAPDGRQDVDALRWRARPRAPALAQALSSRSSRRLALAPLGTPGSVDPILTRRLPARITSVESEPSSDASRVAAIARRVGNVSIGRPAVFGDRSDERFGGALVARHAA
jgi:hypothetical protein